MSDGGENYQSVTVSSEITITKAPQSSFAITTSTEFVYSPDLQIQLTTRDSEPSDSDVSFTVSYKGQDINLDSGNILKNAVAGTYEITAVSDGGANYQSATVSSDITITKANQSSISSSLNSNNIDVSFQNNDSVLQFDINGGSGTGEIVIENTGGIVEVTVNQNTISIKTIRVDDERTTITAKKEGDNNYNESEEISLSIKVVKGSQTKPIELLSKTTEFYEVTNKQFTLELSGGLSTGIFDLIESDDFTFKRDSENKIIVFYNKPFESGLLINVRKEGDANFLELQSSVTVFIRIDLPYLTGKHSVGIVERDDYITIHELIPYYSKEDFLNDGYTVRIFHKKQVTFCRLYNLGWFTVKELKEGGYLVRLCTR